MIDEKKSDGLEHKKLGDMTPFDLKNSTSQILVWLFWAVIIGACVFALFFSHSSNGGNQSQSQCSNASCE